MGGEITKAEYFREHAEFLSAVARCLKTNDKNRATLLSMSHHLENLAEAAEHEAHRSSTKKSESQRGRGHNFTGVASE
jgi:hypothetical protein